MPVVDANAGAAATGQRGRMGWQSASPRVESVGLTPPIRSSDVPTTVPFWASNTNTCPRWVTINNWPGARILGVVGIPITG